MFNFCIIDPSSNSTYSFGFEAETDPFSYILERNLGVPSFETYLALLGILYGKLDESHLARLAHDQSISEEGAIIADRIPSPASAEGRLSIYIHGNLVFIGLAHPSNEAKPDEWLTFSICPDHHITLKTRTVIVELDPTHLKDLSFIDCLRSLSAESLARLEDISPYLRTNAEGNAWLRPLTLETENASFSLGEYMWVTPAEATGEPDEDPQFPVCFSSIPESATGQAN